MMSTAQALKTWMQWSREKAVACAVGIESGSQAKGYAAWSDTCQQLRGALRSMRGLCMTARPPQRRGPTMTLRFWNMRAVTVTACAMRIPGRLMIAVHLRAPAEQVAAEKGALHER
jgi:hypothetical protein